MPNRVIKESICDSMDLAECSCFAQDLYKRLITYADDYGRFNADTTIMRARLFPREYECIDEGDLVDALTELAGVGKIQFYTSTANQKTFFGAFPNWTEHQRVRESKAKYPDPCDTTINDWYLRRFIPMDMKVEIIERDGFKCQICGKFLTTCREAKRFAKLASGLFHIDHIVPVSQGGRATLENLRLTCPDCNRKRKRNLTFKDVLSETLFCNSPQLAATRREMRLESESIYEYESNPNPNTREKSAPTHTRGELKPHGKFKNVMLSAEEYEKLQALIPALDDYIERFSAKVAAKGYHYENHYAALCSWYAEDKRTEPNSSFDIDEFWQAAVSNTYKGVTP